MRSSYATQSNPYLIKSAVSDWLIMDNSKNETLLFNMPFYHIFLDLGKVLEL